MLVVFPPAIRHDESIVPSFYEDHLLERVTLLEIRLSQVAERLAMALDLMLRQTKSTHSDHVLLETLIDSLNTLGAVEKDKLTSSWRKRVRKDGQKEPETVEDKDAKFLKELTTHHKQTNADLLLRLVNEAADFLEKGDEKQSFRMLERAVSVSPDNVPLLFFTARVSFQKDRFEQSADYLEKAFALEKNNEKINLLLAVIYADAFKIEDSQDVLKNIPEKKKFKFLTGYIRAFLAGFEMDWKTALNFFKEISEIYPTAELNYLTACAYFQLKKYKLAIKHLQKAVEEETNYADAWYMLGLIYEMQNDEVKAYQSFELAWSAREAGAQCLEFLQRKDKRDYETALPFLHLKSAKKRLLTGGAPRLVKFFKTKLFKILD